MTFISKLTFNHSRWQVSYMKQGTLTLPEHLVPHALQKCFILMDVHSLCYFFTIVCFERFMTLITDSDKSADNFIIKNFSTYENTAFVL